MNMGKKKSQKIKYQFGIDFQEKILQYILSNPTGYKVLQLIDDTYFTVIPHAIVAYSIKKYYKKRKRIPDEPFLREYIRELSYRQTSIFADATEEDLSQVDTLISKLSNNKILDDPMIPEKVINFSKYVKFKEEIESIDIEDYDSYEAKIKTLSSISSIGREITENYGTFLIGGINDRAHRRNLIYNSTPTPFWQLNNLLNSGGTEKGNLVTVIAEEKRFKTGLLVNIAKGYLRKKKKGVYFDLENGELGLTIRTEQSISNHTRAEILSEEFDNKLTKLFRKYKRLGAELNIKRMPALSSTAADFQEHLDRLKRDHDFVPDFVIVDYGLLMGAISGKKDDFGRISDSFLDLKNFADINNLDCLWTVAHVVRDASKRRGTKYESTDIAKCIDIPRHIDILLGLQESDEEQEAGVMRLEVIEQRDGLREGKCLFWVDIARQSLREFTKAEVKSYRDQLSDTETPEDKKKRRKTDL